MMHKDGIDNELKNLAFEFFHRFSRFEFALKENGKVQSGPRGVAQADWGAFTRAYEADYQLSDCAKELLGSPPDVQKVRDRRLVEWAPLNIDDGKSELSNLVLVVKTVRNNLFHGGKHSAAGWDNPDRVRFLLTRSIEVLDTLARLAGYDADYERRY